MHMPIVFGAIDGRIRGIKPEDLRYQEDFIARTGRDAGHVFFARQLDQLKISDQVVRYMGERSPAPHRKDIAQLLVKKPTRSRRSNPPVPISPGLPPTPAATFSRSSACPGISRMRTRRPFLQRASSQALRGKIVLIGGDFDDRDQHLTPLSVTRDDFFNGLFIHAQILAQLLAALDP